jgi:wobble nucleotide-excising tRNase
MIEEIVINNLATYTEPISMKPLKINFCYGSNGSGKSTLSNFLGGFKSSSESKINWENDNSLPFLVYNKSFVNQQFSQQKNIGGIFTLGKDTKDAKEFITIKSHKFDECNNKIQKFERTIGEFSDKSTTLYQQLDTICWTVQQRLGDRFNKALTGFRGAKRTFRKKCLVEYENFKIVKEINLNNIEQLYDAAFGNARNRYDLIPFIDPKQVEQNEKCALLEQRISGSTDTPIGRFIEYLQNSDWVKQGLAYSVKSDGKCPFCQQALPKDTKNELEEFFDVQYEKDCNSVKAFQSRYNNYFSTLLININDILENKLPMLDYDLFEAEYKIIKKCIDGNSNLIQKKMDSPANIVRIDSVRGSVERLNEIIHKFNEEIEKNNSIVQNQASEQARCKNLLWEYIINELRMSIKPILTQLDNFDKGLVSLHKKIEIEKAEASKIKSEIDKKEETLTSVKPTVSVINKILKRFGFTGFALAENRMEKGTYKITRPDGSDATKTLSEGEYNFITFLYFYHLIYGSKVRTGIDSNKIIVVDDPISSLDSNVLFIISTLVRTIIKDCENDKHGIKQLFVMTHNVYFHKEISYWGSREQPSPRVVAFWIIKKTNNISRISYYRDNPIQTSYELLWAELQEIETNPRITIFNTMRRILEYYFNVIGSLNYDECIDTFEGNDKTVCKSLISCINDGSHFISDDFVMCYETDAMDTYLRIFKSIFVNMGHGKHYEMMMSRTKRDISFFPTDIAMRQASASIEQ